MTDDITEFIRASRERMTEITSDASDIWMQGSLKDLTLANYARTALPRALDMLEAQQKQIADRDRAVDLLADAIGKVEAQAKQIADLRDELADESAVNADWHRYYIALSDLAHGDKPACLAPEVCGEEHGPCKSCAAYKQLAEQQAEIERLTNDLKHIAYNISLSVPPGYGDAEGFYRAGLMSAINRAAWAVSPKDKP